MRTRGGDVSEVAPLNPWFRTRSPERASQFYNHHGLHDDFGGVVTDREEGARIGKAPMHAEILAGQPDLLD